MSENQRHEMIVGGTGGQGVITIGYAIAGAALDQYKYVTRFPIYMATQRGGPAYATVILSDEEIPAPILSNAENCVAMEIRTVCTVLADEMALTNLEMQLGSARSVAMRHMAERTGADDLTSLVALLVQSDRFGTSISETLRTFSGLAAL